MFVHLPFKTVGMTLSLNLYICGFCCYGAMAELTMQIFIVFSDMIQICSGITRGRVLNGALCTEITEVNLSAFFIYRLFHEDFLSIDEKSS